jgi:Flp pilus assembly protein TadG
MAVSAFKYLRCRAKDFLAAEGGVAAVEFALVGPPFLWLFLSIFETGIMLFSEYSLQASVQTASRMIRTGQAEKNGWTVGQFVDQICNNARVVGNCTGKINVEVKSVPGNFNSLTAALPTDAIQIGPGNDGSPRRNYDDGESQSATAVFVTYDWKFTVPFMGAFSNVGSGTRRLVAYTIFRNEPFGGQL